MMAIKDSLQRFIIEKTTVRGEIIHLAESYQTILEQHPYPPAIRKLLGEALCVAGLLSSLIKFTGRLTVQFRGKGKLKMLLAQCNHKFQLRGLAKWEGELNYDDLMEAFNEGILVILLDTGKKGSYQGIVSWRGNSLIESIEGYFQESEQIPSKIWLKIDESLASGLLLQVIPTKEDQSELKKEKNEASWQRVLKLTQTNLHLDDLANMDTASFLNKLYPNKLIRLFSPAAISFHCTCSRKRGEDAILLLGVEEAEAELTNRNSIIVTCDFCNQTYIFDRDDIKKIFQENQNSKKHLH